MKPILIVGIAMIVMGAAVLGYSHFNYTTTEEVLRIGPITARAERSHTVSVPPIVGWLMLGGGACALAFGFLSKKS